METNVSETRQPKIYVVNNNLKYEIDDAKVFSEDPDPFVHLTVGNRLAEQSLNLYTKDVAQRLKDFNPDIDYILIVGTGLTNFLVGSVVSALLPGLRVRLLLRHPHKKVYYPAVLDMLAEQD